MSVRGRVHERAILDALEAVGAEPIAETVWRITRKGRDPLKGSTAHGRWSASGEFEALYTSLDREGSLAEIGYRLSLEPVWPSGIEHEMHRIEVETERVVRFADVAALSSLGVDAANYEGFNYAATQAIAAAAHFMEYDGLIVPSARHPSSNLVIFMDRLSKGFRLELRESARWIGRLGASRPAGSGFSATRRPRRSPICQSEHGCGRGALTGGAVEIQ